MKILFVKIPWMKYYTGEGDEEKTVPDCGYIFQYVNGFYYGYEPNIEKIVSVLEDEKDQEAESISGVTIVWVAENREGKDKIIGWYKEAMVYKQLQEQLTQDSERPVFKYIVKAPAQKAILLPVESRLMDVDLEGQDICLGESTKVLKDISMYIHNYQGEQMNYIFDLKDVKKPSTLYYDEIEMYFAKADEFLAKNLYGKAVRIFNKIIAEEPELTFGYECKGNIFLSLKMYDEALEVYEHLLTLDQENDETLYCLGLIYGLLEQDEKCLYYLDSYLEKNPEDMGAVVERAVAYYRLGQIELAETEIRKAYEVEPDNIQIKDLIAYIKES